MGKAVEQIQLFPGFSARLGKKQGNSQNFYISPQKVAPAPRSSFPASMFLSIIEAERRKPMFDAKNDYSLNKSVPDAIVCRSADGVHIRLTRKDFDSEEEFLCWKNWSDDDYRTMVKTGRG